MGPGPTSATEAGQGGASFAMGGVVNCLEECWIHVFSKSGKPRPASEDKPVQNSENEVDPEPYIPPRDVPQAHDLRPSPHRNERSSNSIEDEWEVPPRSVPEDVTDEELNIVIQVREEFSRSNFQPLLAIDWHVVDVRGGRRKDFPADLVEHLVRINGRRGGRWQHVERPRSADDFLKSLEVALDIVHAHEVGFEAGKSDEFRELRTLAIDTNANSNEESILVWKQVTAFVSSTLAERLQKGEQADFQSLRRIAFGSFRVTESDIKDLFELLFSYVNAREASRLPAQEEQEEEEEGVECCLICTGKFTTRRRALIVDCGHTQVCADCLMRLRYETGARQAIANYSCPTCKKAITSIAFFDKAGNPCSLKKGEMCCVADDCDSSTGLLAYHRCCARVSSLCDKHLSRLSFCPFCYYVFPSQSRNDRTIIRVFTE